MTELAALLKRVAGGAGGKHGNQNSDSLVQVVTSYHPTDPAVQGVGTAELTALREAPDNSNGAETFARTLLDLARADPAFGKPFGT